jgi:DNA (cytosine-5)-methyltransferase 1
VVGVDIEDQPRYAGDEFVRADFFEFVREHGREFDAIHASPPCQFATRATRAWGEVDDAKHPNLIGRVRRLLEAAGRPYVIENVVEAKAHMRHPVTLCGVRFGLKVYRHRLFESNVFLWQPEHEAHPERVPHLGRGASPGGYISVAGNFSDVEAARKAMQIPWMTGGELSQAIPPPYTQFIGEQIMLHLEGAQNEAV